MNPDYIAPATLEEALDTKSRYGAGARVIAGGTDLILRMRDRVLEPEILIDLRRLSLDDIALDGGVLRLGAYTRLSQVMEHPEITRHFPALPEACLQFAGPPIRNLASLGGNIVNASPAADLVPPLIAGDAEIVLASGCGERVLPLLEFFTGPGRNVMRPDEVLTEIRLPVQSRPTAAIFIKLGQRRSMAIAIVNLAVRLTLGEDGSVAEARIVLGSVAPTPIRATAAEAMLVGNPLSDDLCGKAAQKARQEASPISDVRGSEGYRDRMVEVLVRRALTAAKDELESGMSNE